MGRAVGRITALLGLLLLGVMLLGAAYAGGLLGVPSVAGVENRFAGVNQTTTMIQTDVTVSNPNPIGVSFGESSIDYSVWLNEIALAAGSKAGLSVETGNSTMSFRTAMANQRIPDWWVSHIQKDERTTLRVKANVTSGLLGRSVEVTPVERPITTDILSGFNSTETRPVNANVALVSDPVLYINETWAAWGDVSTETTQLNTAFVAYNSKTVPYTVTEVRYEISMNGIVVGDGATNRGHVIEPQTRETIEGGTAIRNQQLDEWWVSHLEQNQVTQLRIDFGITVELAGGQVIEVPLDPLTYMETIETDFFGNKRGRGSSNDTGTPIQTPRGTVTATEDASTATASDTAVTPTGTMEATTTQEATQTSVPTPTPTPTPDDGGLPIGNDTSTDTDVL